MSLEKHHERRALVVRGLAGLRDASAAIGAKTLAARVDQETIRKVEEDRFHLVVVGEFNHGKSTFVNALVGSRVLPTGVTPTTAVIHHLVHSDQPYAKVFTATGEEPLPLDSLRGWAASEGAAERSEKVKYIEVGLPAKLLEERVVLVDTPGVNDLSQTRADITYKYIPKSDAVLFLLDAGQLLKESERVFLDEKLLAKSRDKIVFVVNKADIWSPSERDEAMAYVHRELTKLVKQPIVFALSANKAEAGDVEASGIQPLIDHLSRFLPEERGRLVLDHALAEGLAVASMLGQGLEAKRHAVRMTQEELDRRIAVVHADAEGALSSIDARRAFIREEVAAIKAWARRDLETFCDDLARMLPGEIDKAKASELKVHLAGFLEATFKEWAQAETKEIGAALERLAERVISLVKDDAEAAAKKLGEALDVKPPQIDVDTFAYDVGIFALLTVGVTTMFANLLLGGMLTLAAPLLALYVREKVEEETKARAKEAAPAAVREAAMQIGPKIDEMIEHFAGELDRWVVATGQDMYREMLEVLNAAREERKARDPGDKTALEGIDAQAQQLEAARVELERLRATLWEAPAA
jgi:small GTP-binding protein